DMKSAVIGVGEAMRFAQRLGIGKHTPCILVVTDIGALQVELLPLGGLSAGEVYHRVRGWVDDFYERNQRLISRWQVVEEEISRMQSQAWVSLKNVRDWRDQAAGPTRQLKDVAVKIETAIALPCGDAAVWDNVVRVATTLPVEARALLEKARR